MYKLKNILKGRPYLYALIGFPIAIIAFSMIWIVWQRQKAGIQNNYYKIPHGLITFYEDSKHELSIDQIASLSEESFSQLQSGVPNFGFNRSNIWLRFELNRNVFQDHQKILEIKNPLLNVVELYERSGSEVYLLNRTGDNFSFSSRGNVHRYYRFPLNLESGTAKVYYIKINSGGEQLLAPLAVGSAQALAQRDGEDQLVRGSYFGIILFVLLFNLFVYFIVKEKSTLYYIYYNFFLLMLQLSLGGYAFQYLWPGSPFMANAATPLFASLGVFALVRFSQFFLDLQRFYPRFNKIFKYAGIALLFNSVLGLSGQESLIYFSVVFVNITALLINVAIIPIAVGVYRANFKPARYFLLAFLLLIITVFGFISTNLGILQNDFFAEYGLLIGSIAEVVLLSLAIVDRFKQFKDQALVTLKQMNILQKEQNQRLEQMVLERTAEIQKQKSEIEQKNEEILSSIRYAERIQKNVLPSEEDMSKLFKDHFVIYQPKDIVSGDFYWIGKTKLNGVVSPAHEVLLMAVGDCTGHGVPGAMVSILSSNLLRETVLQNPEVPPHLMLEKLDERMQLAINGTSHEYASDGMDLGFWALQTDTMELRFAGANLNVSVRRNNSWIDLLGTRRPLGMRDHYTQKPFEMSTAQVQPNDVIYCWTDGVTDQFGGTQGKKLKTKGIKSTLEEIAHLPLSNQKEYLLKFLKDWRGGLEQTDDICFSAVKV